MQNAFFIVGPTAVGKTGLAVEFAEHCGAEIVSADAYQIYRGFDLLTAKPTPEQLRRVVHHLVGCVPATATYNAARFLEDACGAIDRATRLGKPVLVVGGNGLYVKALTHGLSPLPAPRPELRGELEALSLSDLLARLRLLDPAAPSTIDVQNKRRVVRALEICLATGKPFSDSRSEWQTKPAADPLGVFLFRDRTDLVSRIDQRVETMFVRGVVDEVRAAGAEGLSPTARQILGLDDIQAYLADPVDLGACRERIKVATRRYAKRQVTWFKRETCFEPINLSVVADAVQQMLMVFTRFQASRTARQSASGACEK